jgi:glycosyltransferase involved in cell wall biosynthesis
MRKASIITPTKERQDHLRLLYEVILSQTEPDWEWLIHDDTKTPSSFFQNLKDPKVHYFHSKKTLTIGEKRNFLNQRASGVYIFHFDDDDYYAPDYLQKGIDSLKESDFFTLSSWFCAHVSSRQFFYWDKECVHESHYILNRMETISSKSFEFETESEKQDFIQKNVYGYGFCYAYRAEVAKKVAFEKTNFGEDYGFFEKAKEHGFRVLAEQDRSGRVLHMMHDVNTTLSFPQYSVPPFMMYQLFPHLQTYLQRYPGSQDE